MWLKSTAVFNEKGVQVPPWHLKAARVEMQVIPDGHGIKTFEPLDSTPSAPVVHLYSPIFGAAGNKLCRELMVTVCLQSVTGCLANRTVTSRTEEIISHQKVAIARQVVVCPRNGHLVCSHLTSLFDIMALEVMAAARFREFG
jgi:hypothetical protein